MSTQHSFRGRRMVIIFVNHYFFGLSDAMLVLSEFYLSAKKKFMIQFTYCSSIRMDILFISTNGSFYIPLVKVVVHEKYNISSTNYDVSLVKLSEPITEQCPRCKSIADISAVSPATGDSVRIVGWGYNNITMNNYSLLTVEETSLSSKDCNDVYMYAGLYSIGEYLTSA